MALGTKHIIQKQVLEVEMENPPDVFGFRNRLGDVFHEKILPRLESLFNEYGEDVLIRIDHLQIDVGILEKANWEIELAEKSINKIKQALLLENPLRINSAVKKKPFNNEHLSSRENERASDDKDASQFPEIFYFFLRNGRLPWYADVTMQLQAELHKWAKEGFGFSDSFKQFLQTASDAEIARLIYQFDKQVLNDILSITLSKEAATFWEDVKGSSGKLTECFRSVVRNTIVSKQIIYLPVFKWLGDSSNNGLNIFYAKSLIASLQRQANLSYEEVCNKLVITLSETKPAKVQSPLVSTLLQLNKTSLINIELDQEDVVIKQNKSSNTDEIFIQNAGLVLLHPFLNPFFQHIGLVDKKQTFVDEPARVKATLLTQHLVTGENMFYEQHLVLNKILCGMPLEDTLITTLKLTEEERTESIDLLMQVIQLWKKNTMQVNSTIEGLRSSFLMRPGKLVKQGKDWKLQVEQKPYDMLLSSLPWGIGIIKNEWMEGMLWVEWT